MAELPSPNHGDRRGQTPRLIVLHYTGMCDGPSARARLCDPDAEVSAHWLLHEDGRAELLVAEDRRAWHAGAGSWCGVEDVNSRSIGIEIVNTGGAPFPEAQMAALSQLLTEIRKRWSILAEDVIGHSDMAPGRKFDPGPRFDWCRLAREGHSIWAGADGRDDDLTRSLDLIGYPPADPATRLNAFRLRFRPWGQGAETAVDRKTAAAAAQAFAKARERA